MNECMLDRQTAGCVVEKIVLPQIVSIKQASEIMKLPPYYLRRVCRENPDIAFQSGVKWYICFLRTWWVSSIMTTAGHLRQSSTRWTDWGMVWNGNVLTAKISASPSQETACTLSDILMSDVEEKYFLSPKQQEVLLFKPTAVTKENESTPPKD